MLARQLVQGKKAEFISTIYYLYLLNEQFEPVLTP